MFELNAKLIEVVEKPYSMNGNEGVSYKLRFLSEKDEIMVFKSNKEQTSSLKAAVGKTGKLVLDVSVYREDVTLKVASFVTKS